MENEIRCFGWQGPAPSGSKSLERARDLAECFGVRGNPLTRRSIIDRPPLIVIGYPS